jgi:hypothetical protein
MTTRCWTGVVVVWGAAGGELPGTQDTAIIIIMLRAVAVSIKDLIAYSLLLLPVA